MGTWSRIIGLPEGKRRYAVESRKSSRNFLLDPTWMSVWHDVTMKLLAKGEMGICFRAVGIDKCNAWSAPDRIYHFAAFLNQLLSQTALPQEYEGPGALPLDCCTSDRRAIA